MMMTGAKEVRLRHLIFHSYQILNKNYLQRGFGGTLVSMHLPVSRLFPLLHAPLCAAAGGWGIHSLSNGMDIPCSKYKPRGVWF